MSRQELDRPATRAALRYRVARRRTPSSIPAPDHRTALAVVAGLSAMAAAFHALVQSRRPLWLDEASTYWTIHAGALDLLRGARTDGTPPLYFLIVSAFTRVFGTSELALRLPSIVAASALVPAIYVIARRMANERAAIIAAALAAISPLVHYYSVEARNYSIVEIETLAILFTAYRALAAPHALTWWALLAAAETTQLWTHNYALFLLPAPAVACLIAGGRARAAVTWRALASASVALILALPCLLRAAESARQGVGDWLAPFWMNTPPSAALFRTFEVFGFGGRYPSYLYLGQAPAIRAISIPLTAAVLAMAVLRWPARPAGPGASAAKYMLLSFLAVPLLAAWLYSWFVAPIYYVGRYDTIVLPVFLIVFAAGLDALLRVSRAAGTLALTLAVVLAVVSDSVFFGAPFSAEQEDVMAAEYLAGHAAPDDPIVTTGLRQPVVAYYLDRSANHRDLISFPSEVGRHPGWWSPARILEHRDQLESDGEQLADTLTATAARGHAVWLLASSQNDVDSVLYRRLLMRLMINDTRSQKQWGVYCLTR
jgi:mannosyltransferase